ncbi:MAG: preprotein translocase subunit SecE [Chlamydiota bacterium]
MKTKRKRDMSVSQKVVQLSAAQKKRGKPKGKKGIGSFFREMKEEMKRVSWTTRDELRNCTKIVVTSIFVFGMGIYLADLFIRLSLSGIENITRWIGG